MHHPSILFLTLLISSSAFGSSEVSKKWTHGRSVCDPIWKPLLGVEANAESMRKPLEQALDYSYQDIEYLNELRCFPEARQAAVELSSELRKLEAAMMSGMRGASCSQDKSPVVRISLLRESANRMRDAELVLEASLDKAERLRNVIMAQIPEGTPFDDCRNKASRGWATARASINKLSCEVFHSVQQLESVDERTALECPSVNRGTASVATAPADAPAAATTIMYVAPVLPAPKN